MIQASQWGDLGMKLTSEVTSVHVSRESGPDWEEACSSRECVLRDIFLVDISERISLNNDFNCYYINLPGERKTLKAYPTSYMNGCGGS